MPRVGEVVLEPYWTTNDRKTVRLYQGNVIDILKRLPEKSVQCVITSPPYWGLRDYGDTAYFLDRKDAESWAREEAARRNTVCSPGVRYLNNGARWSEQKQRWGGSVGCEVRWPSGAWCSFGSEASPDCQTWGRGQCGQCHVCNATTVFREVRRVLRDDGTLWLNYGDSYNANTGAGFNGNAKRPEEARETRITGTGLKSGNLVGVPWRVALALQADGWVLRQDIIWHKPSPMPESCRNRCTKAHEYVFLLVKRQGYYYDHEAIKEDQVSTYRSEDFLPNSVKDQLGVATGPTMASRANRSPEPITDAGRNKRSVWTIASGGYAGAHFATFPPRLIEPMILAGTSEKGCCTRCGAPWKRVTEEKQLTRERPNDYVKRSGEEGTGNSCPNTVAGVEVKTVGWEPSCECQCDTVRPCIVMDPFIGSGTTCCVAMANDRHSIGIDLSERYLRENAIPRITGEAMNRRCTQPLVMKTRERVEIEGAINALIEE